LFICFFISIFILSCSNADNEASDPVAQYELGLNYYLGIGALQNYERSAALFKKAADQGNIDAMLHLGIQYYKGQGVQKNVKFAQYYWTKVADTGIFKPSEASATASELLEALPQENY
jgi:uncharacterized protein